MAEGKRGFLQGILQSIPLVGWKKEVEAKLPERGPVDIYVPSLQSRGGKVADSPKGGPDTLFFHRIKYKGIFDLDKLYKVMALWFKERRFELYENLFKSKPPELEVRWVAERKRTSYVRELVSVHMHMWGDYDVEVIQNGKKKRMVNVRMVITINGGIHAAYADIFGKPRWNASNLERQLQTLMYKWVMKREIAGLYEDRLYYELYNLYGLIKETLKFGAR